MCTRCTGWRGASLRSCGAVDAAARGVVEDVDAVGAGRLLQDALDFGVVDAAHLLVVEEVAHGARDGCTRAKPLASSDTSAGDRTRVVDRRRVWASLTVLLRGTPAGGSKV